MSEAWHDRRIQLPPHNALCWFSDGTDVWLGRFDHLSEYHEAIEWRESRPAVRYWQLVVIPKTPVEDAL